jgi:hypothetical protein
MNNEVPGPLGGPLSGLLKTFVTHGRSELAAVVAGAIARVVAAGGRPAAGRSIFDPAARLDLFELLAGVVGSADLAGRAIAKGESGQESPRKVAGFVTDLVPLPPERAIEYFEQLDPQIVADPATWLDGIHRRAFAIARRTDKQVTQSVYEAIKSELQTGRPAVQAVTQILDDSGTSENNPAYAELVVRTNVMQSLNAGHEAEVRGTPEVAAMYPVWQYHAIRDGRERPNHGRRDGQYYPAQLTFAEVRGTQARDVINCRCNFSWVSRPRWRKLEAQGAILSTI